MLFKYYGAKALFLSLIVAVGHVNGASSASNATEQNLGPHGLDVYGTVELIIWKPSAINKFWKAKVERNGTPSIKHEPTCAEFSGHKRTINDFLNMVQRNTDGKYPSSSFWRSFIWAAGIPTILLCGIYKMPYINNMDAQKKAFITGCAAAVGIGFVYEGLHSMFAATATRERAIMAEATRQHDRFIDDKMLFLSDVVKKILEEPIAAPNPQNYMRGLGCRTMTVNTMLDSQKGNPSTEILQEVRAAYFQVEAPKHRAYVAAGLLSGLGSLYVMHQTSK